jgi:hypothetical protein
MLQIDTGSKSSPNFQERFRQKKCNALRLGEAPNTRKDRAALCFGTTSKFYLEEICLDGISPHTLHSLLGEEKPILEALSKHFSSPLNKPRLEGWESYHPSEAENRNYGMAFLGLTQRVQSELELTSDELRKLRIHQFLLRKIASGTDRFSTKTLIDLLFEFSLLENRERFPYTDLKHTLRCFDSREGRSDIIQPKTFAKSKGFVRHRIMSLKTSLFPFEFNLRRLSAFLDIRPCPSSLQKAFLSDEYFGTATAPRIILDQLQPDGIKIPIIKSHKKITQESRILIDNPLLPSPRRRTQKLKILGSALAVDELFEQPLKKEVLVFQEGEEVFGGAFSPSNASRVFFSCSVEDWYTLSVIGIEVAPHCQIESAIELRSLQLFHEDNLEKRIEGVFILLKSSDKYGAKYSFASKSQGVLSGIFSILLYPYE